MVGERLLGSPRWTIGITLLLGMVFAIALSTALHARTARRISAIDDYVLREMTRERIPGLALGIYQDGKPVLARGYGLANIEWQTKVTPDTAFESASLGKQFTAAAVMLLVQDGKVSLTDSVTRFFPDAPAAWRPIRVEHLLAQTSGLPELLTTELNKPGALFDLRLDLSEEEIIQRVETLPLQRAAGEQWDYCNTNYVLLGALIHRVSGKSYGDFLSQRLFKPLGMTTTRTIAAADIVTGHAAGYELHGGQWLNQVPSFNSTPTGDGSLYINVADMARWDEALASNKLLSRASIQRMWTPPNLASGKPAATAYGFGWYVDDKPVHRSVWHDGAWKGFSTYIVRFLDDGLTVVVLTNLDADHSRPGQIARVIAGMIEPGLMPATASAIPDDQPKIAQKLRAVLEGAAAGADLSAQITPQWMARITAEEKADIAAALPPDWSKAPLALMTRAPRGAETTSAFRIGPAGDFRRVQVRSDASGRIERLRIVPDPDNR